METSNQHRRLGWLEYLDATPAQQAEDQRYHAVRLATDGVRRLADGQLQTGRESIVQAVRAGRMAQWLDPTQGGS